MQIHDLLNDFRKSGKMAFYVDYFLQNPKRIDDLVNVVVNEVEYPYPEYASWILIHIQKANPMLIEPFTNGLIDVILKSDNQSVLRNCCNMLQFIPKTTYRESELLDRFIDFIQSNDNKVALQVYSMYCLVKFVKQYPELKIELVSLVNLYLNERSPAYKVAVRKFLERIKDLI